jgi:phosphatidylinositol alpha-mannosyltransferase
MRIAIVCPYNYFIPGGVQTHVHEQTRLLRSRGHEVIIITPRPYRLPDNAPEGVVFLGGSARVKAPHATSGDVSVSVELEAIDELLEQYNFDIVHVHEPLVPFMARQLLSRVEVPRVGTFHAALPGNILGKSLAGSYKAYARTVLPLVDVITAVSPAAVGYIEEKNELEINYIPNGISLTDYDNDSSIKRSKNTILFLGRLEKRKGAKYIIQAFEVLKNYMPEAKLVIAGDGPLRQSLETFVDNRGISDVTFLGFVSEAKKKKLLRTCTVFTSPALYGESFGIVLAEAMALGTPIVAHQNDGYSWVMKDTGRLSLVNVQDKNAYADRLLLLMQDEEIRRVWQTWALKYVQQFSYEKIVDAYEALYKKLVKS